MGISLIAVVVFLEINSGPWPHYFDNTVINQIINCP